MKSIVVEFLLLSLLCLHIAAAQESVKYEIKVNVLSKSLDGELAYIDIFDNISSLPYGNYNLQFPTVLMDQYWNHQTTFLLDKKYVNNTFKIDQKSKFWKYYGSDATTEAEMNFDVMFQSRLKPIENKWSLNPFELSNKFYTENYQKRENTIQNYIAKKENFLTEYTKENKLDSLFLTKWKSVLLYEGLSYKLFLNNYEKWPANYLNDLLKLNYVSDGSLCYVPSYRRYLWGYLNLLCYNKFKKNTFSLSEYEKVINENFKDTPKEYLLVALLVKCKSRGYNIKYTEQEYVNLLDSLVKTLKIEYFNNYVSNLTRSNTIHGNKDVLLTINHDKKTLSEVLNTGKIIYVDFWATWCAPCKAELPALKKIVSVYADKKIDFIAISIDSNINTWEKDVKSAGFNLTNNYLITGGIKSAFLKELKINSIPRYIIVKNGKVINSDAPRPSDIQFHKLISQLIND